MDLGVKNVAIPLHLRLGKETDGSCRNDDRRIVPVEKLGE